MARGRVEIKLGYSSYSGWKKDSSWMVDLRHLQKEASFCALQKRSHCQKKVREEERASKVPITLPRVKFLEKGEK
jgi:hypothetical protein